MPRKSSNEIPYNEQAVRRVAQTKHGAQSEYPIKDVPGLRLVCLPSGTAFYSVRYTVNGARKRAAIGQHGVVSLADARARALAVAAGAATDVDVLAKEAKDKARPTLRKLWEAREGQDDALEPSTKKKHTSMFETEVFPEFGSRYADEITTDEWYYLLASIEDRTTGPTGRTVDGKEKVRAVKNAVSSLYKYGQKRRLVKINPLAGLGFNRPSKVRKIVPTDEDIRKLWNGIAATKSITEPMRNIIRLAILTGQRNNEVAGMEVAELKNIDGANPRWDIPGRRMKRKTADQHVPLSRQAAEIVAEALAKSSNGVHVFEGASKGRRDGVWLQGHISQKSVSRAVARVRKQVGLGDVHLHDIRKSVTSWLAEHGHTTPEVLDAILHHARPGVTGSHYNFALYEQQVRKALQLWADHVWRVAGLADDGGEVGRVVQLMPANR